MQTIFLMTEATQVALIVGGFGFAGIVVTSLVQVILAIRRSDQVVTAIKKEVVEGNEKVAQAVDGQLSKYVEEVRRAERETGKREGGEAERDRPPDLIIEPAQVAEAMNGKGVREQMNVIEEKLDANTSLAVDAKDADAKVAEDLAKSRAAAKAVVGGEAGEAADAAARLTGKEKQLLDKDSSH